MKTATQSKLSDILAKLGVTMQSSSCLTQADDKGWEHFGFQCSLSRNGKVFWAGPYKLGLAHVNLPPKEADIGSYGIMRCIEHNQVMWALRNNPGAKFLPEFQCHKLRVYQQLAVKQKLAPKLNDVMHSLLSDGSAHWDNESFEEWVGNFGCSSDSVKALKTFEECVEIGRAISRTFHPIEIEEMRETAQDM